MSDLAELRLTTPQESASGPLEPAELELIDAYWRAANYLSVGQLYLLTNALLREPLTLDHIKPRPLGHWGTTPGLNFIYAHLNRVINAHDLDMLYVTGPGHGGAAIVANAYLEGTYSELYPDVCPTAAGMDRLFRQFSFPGGIPSHVDPCVPGSIHEGGELGYSLAHAFGAAFDSPDLVVACVIGDGEAETGPLATSWHSNKFLNPTTDGAVLPIVHLNGYKLHNPSVLARIERWELESLLTGYGWCALFVDGNDPGQLHQRMAAALDHAVAEIRAIQVQARGEETTNRPRWPMLVLSTPKGWTGPEHVDGRRVEGHWRSHQIPLAELGERPERVADLERWLRSYRPQELFDERGALVSELAQLAPTGTRRMSANPVANGGGAARDLRLPDFRDYAVTVTDPAAEAAEATRVLGAFLRDVMALNHRQRNFRVFGADVNDSNRLNALYQVTSRTWLPELRDGDDDLAVDGRVMEYLSEHTCQGWLEGYLLTGRHGIFSSYEAFIQIIDSMLNQHAKWLKTIGELSWRRTIPSLNYLLTSHVWRQEHNGYSHQDPGFLDHVVSKQQECMRVYLPPDANTLLCVSDRCLRTRNLVNVIIAGKHAAPQFLDMEAAIRHCARGIGIWDWASTGEWQEPDVVLACAGDIPTLETLAAASLLREHVPALRVRLVNVVDLMALQLARQHPHGLSDLEFEALFGVDRPVIFNFHGYPSLIDRLVCRRPHHRRFHVHGYRDEGTTTTPFDMAVLNQIDRFHLVCDVIDHVAQLRRTAAHVRLAMLDKLAEHTEHICRYGRDLPEITEWRWPA